MALLSFALHLYPFTIGTSASAALWCSFESTSFLTDTLLLGKPFLPLHCSPKWSSQQLLIIHMITSHSMRLIGTCT
ncbi:hypothetical protein BHM03_00057548 [Ensete ventricosum]|nr:hypothetical protein BHM03_00057548 [Ensete ventricosum]